MAGALRLIEHDELGLTTEQRALADAAADRIRQLAQDAILNAIEIGRHLDQVRSAVPRGLFVRWLDDEFRWSRATAYRYMGLAAVAADEPGFSQREKIRGMRLVDFYEASRQGDDISPHDGDDPSARPREDVRQLLIESLRRELEAVRGLADDARMVAAMLGDAWNHLVAQARALDRSRNVANHTARSRVAHSPALDEVQRRRLMLLDDPTLEKLATAWATPFTSSARVFAEMQGDDVSFDQVRYYQKVFEALQR